MRPRIGIPLLFAACAILFNFGCAHIWPAWAVDYGKSAGQFTAATARVKAAKFLHQRITVEGKVTHVESAAGGRQKVWVGDSVICDEFLGQVKIGEEKRFAGVVQSVDERHVVLRPSMVTTEDFHAQ